MLWTWGFFIKSAIDRVSTGMVGAWLLLIPLVLPKDSKSNKDRCGSDVDMAILDNAATTNDKSNCPNWVANSHVSCATFILAFISYLSTVITMSVCQCSQCFPSRNRAIKTIQKHLHEDKILLNSSGHRHTQEFTSHLQNCIDLNARYLESLGSSDEGKLIHTYYMVESERGHPSRFRQLVWCRWV